jgi:hypothetical protein
MSTVEEKNGHVAANAEARVENENQKHCYCENESAGHITSKFPHQGENDERVAKASSKVTAGRHITSKNGLVVAKERSAHVAANRVASAKLFDSNKLSVVPEKRKK